jgi:hypothetical protein
MIFIGYFLARKKTSGVTISVSVTETSTATGGGAVSSRSSFRSSVSETSAATDAASSTVTSDPPVTFVATTKGIFGFGINGVGSLTALTNLVSNTGVVATDTTGVGTARVYLAAAGYGGDKGIFGYGFSSGGNTTITNLVSNTGVVAADVTGVATARYQLAACGYGGNKSIFAYGDSSAVVSDINRVSSTGVVSANSSGVGTARSQLSACGYGNGLGIFAYGYNGITGLSMSNLVSNIGIFASDTDGVGTFRRGGAACSYGTTLSLGIFGYGVDNSSVLLSVTNKVSNTGVVAANTTGVGTARYNLAACAYGGDKGIFGYGDSNFASAIAVSTTNLISNTGVVAANTTGVGTTRYGLAACGYSF